MRLAPLLALVLFTAIFTAVPAEAATVVFLIGEREYDTRETLPRWAADWLEPAGHDCIFVHALADDRDRFPGASLVDRADLLVISVRRRALPKTDLDRVRAHVAAGRPVIGIRTACHAFDPRGELPDGHDAWRTFDVDVLGARYDNHLRTDGCTVTPRADAAAHPVLAGLPPQPWESQGSLYRMFDLDPAADRLVDGLAVEQGETKIFPVVWVRTLASGSRVFSTTLGSASDFEQPAMSKLLANGAAWCLNESVGPVAVQLRDRTDEPAAATGR